MKIYNMLRRRDEPGVIGFRPALTRRLAHASPEKVDGFNWPTLFMIPMFATFPRLQEPIVQPWRFLRYFDRFSRKHLHACRNTMEKIHPAASAPRVFRGLISAQQHAKTFSSM